MDRNEKWWPIGIWKDWHKRRNRQIQGQEDVLSERPEFSPNRPTDGAQRASWMKPQGGYPKAVGGPGGGTWPRPLSPRKRRGGWRSQPWGDDGIHPVPTADPNPFHMDEASDAKGKFWHLWADTTGKITSERKPRCNKHRPRRQHGPLWRQVHEELPAFDTI